MTKGSAFLRRPFVILYLLRFTFYLLLVHHPPVPQIHHSAAVPRIRF
jgi:hypothetical protein